jgi:hypothetical protein
VSYEELRSMLEEDSGDVPPPPSELKEHEVWLLRHLSVAAALLLEKEPLYRELLAQWEAEGPSDELRAKALYEAGALGLVLQSARRRPEVLVGAFETPYKPSLGALDQLFYSFTLLTTPSADDDYTEVRIGTEELDEFFENPKLKEWLAQMGAEGGA